MKKQIYIDISRSARCHSETTLKYITRCIHYVGTSDQSGFELRHIREVSALKVPSGTRTFSAFMTNFIRAVVSNPRPIPLDIFETTARSRTDANVLEQNLIGLLKGQTVNKVPGGIGRGDGILPGIGDAIQRLPPMTAPVFTLPGNSSAGQRSLPDLAIFLSCLCRGR